MRPKDKDNLTIQKRLINNFLPEKIHEPGINPIVIFDGMNLAHRAFNAYSKLRHKGKSVSILFGIPQIIKSFIIQNKPEKVIVVWDGKRNSERIKRHNEYKSHRAKVEGYEDKRIEIDNQVERVKRLLYYMGITQIYNPAIEGDDMIYLVVKKYKILHPIRIVSSDKDMLQLCDNDVTIDNPMNAKSGMVTPMLIYIEKNYHCFQVVDYLCLVGDDSDDIPGYYGIGDARARKFLNQYVSINAYLKNKKSDFPGLNNKQKLKKLWKKNRFLIDLKRFCDKRYTSSDILYYREKQNPQFNEEKFRKIVYKWGMNTIILPSFINTFNHE